jgi:oligosaccharide repeat unit polymerase
MRFSFSFLALSAYIIPALLAVLFSSTYGYDLTSTGLLVILLSVGATLTGAILGSARPRSIPKLIRRPQIPVGFPHLLGYSFLIVGLISISIDFYLVGSIPILSNGTGRIELQHSFLWNIYILCAFGVFLYSFSSYWSGHRRLGLALSVLYIFAALISAWKGTFLFILILFLTPYVKYMRIPLFYITISVISILTLFFLVNYFRSDTPIDHVAQQLMYYLIWGFVNFDAEALNSTSVCLHTIPIVGCMFSVNNDLLISPTWNVFSALSPIYLDGGPVYVFLFFLVLSFLLTYLERRSTSISGTYFYFLLIYWFIVAHNGYSFYSSSLILSAGMSIVINLVFPSKTILHDLQRGPHPQPR